MRQAVRLAEEMGKGMAGSEILFGQMQFGTGVACRLVSSLERAFRRSLNSAGSPGLSALDFHTEQSYAGSSASSQALLLRLFEMLLLVCSHIYSIIFRV